MLACILTRPTSRCFQSYQLSILNRRGVICDVTKVLVVDDDRALQKALKVGLTARGHVVTAALTGEEGLSKFALEQPELLILDLGLPDLDGLEICHRIRTFSETPIIVLSAIGLEDRKVLALDSGANDYVTKPFGMAELEARIRTALRGRQPEFGPECSHLKQGDLEIDLVHHEARYQGRSLELTSKEFDLLLFFAKNAGKVCTHQMILGHVWGSSYSSEAEYLRVYVYRLRRKLGDSGNELLRTAPGIGYSIHLD